jgi:hypothetical protein
MTSLSSSLVGFAALVFGLSALRIRNFPRAQAIPPRS